MNDFIKTVSFFMAIISLASCQRSDLAKVSSTNCNNIQQYVTVKRNPGSDTVTFVFSKMDNWRIYKLDRLNAKAKDQPNLTTTKKDTVARIIVENSTTRYYFLLKNSNNDSALVAETALPMANQANFQDLGGIICLDGRSVKWGCLFRSGALNKLSVADRIYMKSAGIKVDIDFRRYDEWRNAKDLLPSGVDTIRLPITTPPNDREINNWINRKDAIALDTMFMRSYICLVSDTNCQEQYHSFLKRLASGKITPTVYHCSGGKDRTGFATVLLLSALGVDSNTIISNYLETNQYLSAQANDSMINSVNARYNDKRGELMRRSMTVNYNYIKTSLDIVDKKYGGMQKYLNDVLHVDVNFLRNKYLEK
jgi:protein-tyrosine phosphatase